MQKRTESHGFGFIPGIKYKKLAKVDLDEAILKARAGDQHAFTDILCHMHNYLCHLTTKFFIMGGESQDVYQEGAIKLMNVIEKFDPEKGGFTTFAQSSIKKHIITSMNKERARKRSILNNSYSLDSGTTNDEGESVSFLDMISGDNSQTGATPIGNPLDIVEKDYENYIVEQICNELSDMESKVFVLRCIRSMSYKEVARELKLYKRDRKSGKRVLDPKIVDNAIWRSRPKIRRVLERLNVGADALPSMKSEKRDNNAKHSEVQNHKGGPGGRDVHRDAHPAKRPGNEIHNGDGRKRSRDLGAPRNASANR